MMSIGAVAVAPSAPQTVWVGTGEANTRQSSSWGDGVYKSTDAGKTWTNMGLKDTRSIGRIVIDPTNADVVYVAAQGHLWGPNAERGVFKTTDGGRTWKKVLFVDENTGANDLVIDPVNPQVLYAATYQRQRTAWGFNGGGPGSGIYKTIGRRRDVDEAHQRPPGRRHGTHRAHALRHGSERSSTRRSKHARRTAASFARTDGGDNVGEDLTAQHAAELLLADPHRPARQRAGSTRSARTAVSTSRMTAARRSPSCSATCTARITRSGWIPTTANHLIIGGDGGVSISWDRGHTWDFRRNMPVGQFYEIDVDNSVPFRICGGLQDNGVWCVPSAVRNRNGIADRDGWNIGGGDGFHAHFDPANSSMVLQSSQNGNVAWVNIETLERQGVRPGSGERPAPGGGRGGRGGRGGAAPAAAGEGEEGAAQGGGRGGGYRWNWDTPIVVSHHDPKTWYMGAQVLFKSTDRGSSWQKISGDLTLDINRDTLTMMGKVVGPTRCRATTASRATARSRRSASRR